MGRSARGVPGSAGRWARGQRRWGGPETSAPALETASRPRRAEAVVVSWRRLPPHGVAKNRALRRGKAVGQGEGGQLHSFEIIFESLGRAVYSGHIDALRAGTDRLDCGER